ncbi:hypothetical protein L2D01_09870 [Hyphomonadaceae bacterium ML37]|nr:hypothetical protein L2D01_09870 [Hyphomonadaceae bacterium ML37]
MSGPGIAPRASAPLWLALAALLSIDAALDWRGALQRIAEAAFLTWFIVCGAWLRRPAQT